MKLISLDQSSNLTGISYFIDNEWQYSTVIDSHKIKNTDARFDNMVSEIYKVIVKEQPDIVVLEQVALQSNAKTMMLLARLQGAIIGKCIESNIQYKIIEVSRWRKIVGIHQGKKKRDELKAESMYLAHKWFDDKLTEDASESALIGAAYLKLNNLIELPEYNEEFPYWGTQQK